MTTSRSSLLRPWRESAALMGTVLCATLIVSVALPVSAASADSTPAPFDSLTESASEPGTTAPPTSAATSPATSAVQRASTKPCTMPKSPRSAGAYPVLYRPTTKAGMKDAGVFAINHVREAQYRLKWLGHYKGTVNGYYGYETRRAVIAFQKANCFKATGDLNGSNWAHLIRKSTKNLGKVPAVCKRSGWNTCYDRATHQDFLFKDGELINVWLVRGGSRAEQTRTGTYRVFARYAYKISSLYNVPMWHFQKHSGGQGQHGSGFMIDPFVGHSHGCINMYLKDAKVLWAHTKNQRLTVTVYGAWS